MDTDDLSIETYDAIIREAERFTHNLTHRFAVVAADCENEEQYLNEISEMIAELRGADDDDLYGFFFAEPPSRKNLNAALDRISENIQRVREIPESKRTYFY